MEVLTYSKAPSPFPEIPPIVSLEYSDVWNAGFGSTEKCKYFRQARKAN